jgi:hypothetical protein
MLAVWWVGGRRVANRRVSIWTYKKVDGKWRYSKPLVGKNNKIKPEPGAAYYIRFREGAKLVWRKCRNAADAKSHANGRKSTSPPTRTDSRTRNKLSQSRRW